MELLTLQKAAKLAELSSSRLRDYIDRGELKATKRENGYYAIARADLEEFLAKPKRAAGNPDTSAMANARWGKAAGTPAKPRSKGIDAPMQAAAGEMIIPAGVKITRIPAPAPRFQTFDLPGSATSNPHRASGEDFRQHQRKGRF